MSFGVHSNNPVVRSVVEGTAPRPACVAASRGILPLPQSDLLEILVSFYDGDDAELKENARQTLSTQSSVALDGTLSSHDTAPAVLAYFVAQEHLPNAAYQSIIQNANTPSAAIAGFARKTTSGDLLELISLNQQLLIRDPSIIEAIIGNSHRTSEADRRANETKREFFKKERGAQQIANELRAQGKEAAAEFVESVDIADDGDDSGLSAEDALFLAQHIEVLDKDTDDEWLRLEFIEDLYEESEAQRKATLDKIIGELKNEEDEIAGERISMINKVMRMGVKDRVKLGMKGDREARNILIRDPNRLVSSAVVNNPRISEQEIENIASMRSLSEDVLRQIASNRQWSRSYGVMHSLVRNPRTPIANSLTIMSRLQLRDLTALSKNRNVSDGVRRHAARLLSARTGGRG
ncbi:MAG TPA: hypothetical protein PLD38_15070 [Pyrinomonadaceae bacterium]|nr:hypothetical protein [Chloracidobacterium sp.]MBP9936854.1 hypothetical protein [Pyrinomonadaceae bacterium]HQY68596.1 hypothetical protein [Pyrinomonadaceae bacterium]